MKRSLLFLATACVAFAQNAGDINITRRNDTNTAYETAVLTPLPDFQDGIWALNGANGRPIYLQVGQNLGRDGNFLQVQGLTKASVGLANVDNTSDAAKPISTATQTALDAKAASSALSTVAFSGAYADLGGKPSLASVATTGAYSDLSGKPTLGTAAAQNTTAFATAAQGVKADAAQPLITAGTTDQYYRGDKTWQTLPAVPTPSYLTPPTFSSMTTATVLHASRWTDVSYDIPATVTISLLAGQSVTATLRYADNSGMSTNVVTLSVQSTANSGVLNLTQTNMLKLAGKIPPGKYRQVTFGVTGSGVATPSTLSAGWELLTL